MNTAGRLIVSWGVFVLIAAVGSGPALGDEDSGCADRAAAASPAPAHAGSDSPTMDASIATRLRDLEYPELRQRDPREIAILQDRVRVAQMLFEMAKARSDAGLTPPGEVQRAGHALAAARAELAWAQHRVRDAVTSSIQAAQSAQTMMEASMMAYRAGLATLEEVVHAQAFRAGAQLAVIRAQQVAAAANVDISDIEIPEYPPKPTQDTRPESE